MVFLITFILGDRPKNVLGDDLEFSLVNCRINLYSKFL